MPWKITQRTTIGRRNVLCSIASLSALAEWHASGLRGPLKGSSNGCSAPGDVVALLFGSRATMRIRARVGKARWQQCAAKSSRLERSTAAGARCTGMSC